MHGYCVMQIGLESDELSYVRMIRKPNFVAGLNDPFSYIAPNITGTFDGFFSLLKIFHLSNIKIVPFAMAEKPEFDMD